MQVRTGLTRVETITLTFILSMLLCTCTSCIGAVTGAREAARRSACSNNLKQLILAVHSYHDANNDILPLYSEGAWSPSWAVLLLPYMEQRGLYQQAADQAKSGGSWSLQGTDSVLANFTSQAFICPTRRGPMLAQDSKLGFAATPTDYAACNSTSSCWALDTPEYRGNLASGAIVAPETPGSAGQVPRGRFSFGGIRDGLSYTAFFGEKHLPRDWTLGESSSLDGPCVTVGDSPQQFNSIMRRMGTAVDPQNSDCGTVQIGIREASDPSDKDVATFGSWHAGICQFAMGDGSVTKISSNMDPQICTWLIHRNDDQQALVLEE